MLVLMQIHASCVARDDDGDRVGLLLLGASGSGKSDLALQLIGQGFTLVADDRVDMADGWASAPASLAGLLEVWGLGVVRMPFWPKARLALAVRLDAAMTRLPEPVGNDQFGLPEVRIDPTMASAAARVKLALDCALQPGRCQVGAFACQVGA